MRESLDQHGNVKYPDEQRWSTPTDPLLMQLIDEWPENGKLKNTLLSHHHNFPIHSCKLQCPLNETITTATINHAQR